MLAQSLDSVKNWTAYVVGRAVLRPAGGIADWTYEVHCGILCVDPVPLSFPPGGCLTSAQWLSVAVSLILLMCAGTWLRASRADRRLGRGMRNFGLFNLSAALGIALIGLPIEPEELARMVGDLLVVAAFVWLTIGVRQLFKIPGSGRVLHGYAVAGAIAIVVLGVMPGRDHERAAVLFVTISAISMHGCVIAGRQLALRGRRESARALMIAGIGYGAVMLGDAVVGLVKGDAVQADLSLSSSAPVVITWLAGGFLVNMIVVLEVHHQSVTRLEQLALTDPLTGLPNRRAFDQALEQECERSRRMRTGCAVVLGDIDDFKKVNDTWGHAEGDAVLAEVASSLDGCLRRGDTLARFGGDEFAVLLPQTDLATAEAICRRLRESVSGSSESMLLRRWQYETSGPVTVSFGVAANCSEPAERSDDLVRRADQALYEAKRTGRNRACVAG